MSELDDQQCAKCGERYEVRDGDEPTKYCDHCAHQLAEALEPTWTSDPPTVPGWYWWRDTFGCQGVSWFHGLNHGEYFGDKPSWKFSGPIPEPQEPPSGPTPK